MDTREPRRLPRGLLLCFVLSLAVQAWQSYMCSPLTDEDAHLASGLATVRFGDFGHYRVNPPIHRLWSAVAVEAVFRPPMPSPVPASLTEPGLRKEFQLGTRFLEDNAGDYRSLFFVARLARIPLVLFAGWLLYIAPGRVHRRAGAVAAILWLTSPLVLGHGWAVLPDAFSGVAMAGVLFCTLSWLRNRSRLDLLAVGIAWGIAISTKFTFCPLFAVWPVALLIYQWARGRLVSVDTLRILGGHVLHGFVALAIVWYAYGFTQLGVPLKDHHFASKMFGWIGDVGASQTVDAESLPAWKKTLGPLLGKLPSPFPKQFLAGIDEQRMDFAAVHATYVLGTKYDEPIWWYYFPGYLIKEQLAAWLGMLLFPWGAWRLWRASRQRPAEDSESVFHSPTSCRQVQLHSENGNVTSRELFSELSLLLVGATMMMFILSWHSNLAINVRYLFPMLPLVYLAIGICLARWTIAIGQHKNVDVWCWTLLVIAVAEVVLVFPHHFAYANPAFGGPYRVPPPLHDSNFDWGQDLWYLEDWLTRNGYADGSTKPFVCMHSEMPSGSLGFEFELPDEEMIQRARQQHTTTAASRSVAGAYQELIVFRGLGVPAPWTFLVAPNGSRSPPSTALQQLLMCRPDEFITPTIAVYRVWQLPGPTGSPADLCAVRPRRTGATE